jgi:hypothetical protein
MSTEGSMPTGEHVPEVQPAPPATGNEVAPIAGQPGEVPDAVPGRRLQAFGLGALAVVLVPAAFLLWSLRAMPAGVAIAGGIGIAVAAAGWLADARTPRRWVGWSLLAAFVAVLANFGLAPAGLLALVAQVVCWWLARSAYRRFSTPGFDLAEADVEVGFRLYERRPAELRIGRDRAVLALARRRGGGHVDQAIALAEVSLAQPGEITAEDVWPLPGADGLRLPPGPAVRVVAGRQQWIVPVAEPRLVAAILRRRQTAAWPQRTGPQDLNAWHALRDWAAERNTAHRYGRRVQSRTWFRGAAGFVLGTLGLMMLTALVADGAAAGMWPAGVGAVLLGAFLVISWLRLRRRLEFAELNQLPPGSPSWGDPRAGVAPIPSWRPWV